MGDDPIAGANVKMKSTNKIIFIIGVHGVGKSSLSKMLQREFGIRPYTASEIIRDSIHLSSDKLVESIAENQLVLLREISKIRTQHNTFILDGHLVLLDKNMTPTPIDIGVVAEISPSVIVFVNDAPDEIARRLRKRDRAHSDISLISIIQDLERSTALRYCKTLGIPFIDVNFQLKAGDSLSNLSKWISTNL